MEQILCVISAECRKAMDRYAGELQKAGIKVSVREVSDDSFELLDEPQETIVAVEWPDAEENRVRASEGWEDEIEEEGQDDDAGAGVSLQLLPYIQTLQALGRDPAAAKALLDRL